MSAAGGVHGPKGVASTHLSGAPIQVTVEFQGRSYTDATSNPSEEMKNVDGTAQPVIGGLDHPKAQEFLGSGVKGRRPSTASTRSRSDKMASGRSNISIPDKMSQARVRGGVNKRRASMDTNTFGTSSFEQTVAAKFSGKTTMLSAPEEFANFTDTLEQTLDALMNPAEFTEMHADPEAEDPPLTFEENSPSDLNQYFVIENDNIYLKDGVTGQKTGESLGTAGGHKTFNAALAQRNLSDTQQTRHNIGKKLREVMVHANAVVLTNLIEESESLKTETAQASAKADQLSNTFDALSNSGSLTDEKRNELKEELQQLGPLLAQQESIADRRSEVTAYKKSLSKLTAQISNFNEKLADANEVGGSLSKTQGKLEDLKSDIFDSTQDYISSRNSFNKKMTALGNKRISFNHASLLKPAPKSAETEENLSLQEAGAKQLATTRYSADYKYAHRLGNTKGKKGDGKDLRSKKGQFHNKLPEEIKSDKATHLKNIDKITNRGLANTRMSPNETPIRAEVSYEKEMIDSADGGGQALDIVLGNQDLKAALTQLAELRAEGDHGRGDLQARIDSANEKIAEFNGNVSAHADTLGELSAERTDLEAAGQSIADKFSGLQEQINSLEKEYGKQAGLFNKTKAQVQEFNSKIQDFNNKISAYQNEVAEFAEKYPGIEGLGANQRTLNVAVDRLNVVIQTYDGVENSYGIARKSIDALPKVSVSDIPVPQNLEAKGLLKPLNYESIDLSTPPQLLKMSTPLSQMSEVPELGDMDPPEILDMIEKIALPRMEAAVKVNSDKVEALKLENTDAPTRRRILHTAKKNLTKLELNEEVSAKLQGLCDKINNACGKTADEGMQVGDLLNSYGAQAVIMNIEGEDVLVIAQDPQIITILENILDDVIQDVVGRSAEDASVKRDFNNTSTAIHNCLNLAINPDASPESVSNEDKALVREHLGKAERTEENATVYDALARVVG